MLRRSEKAFQLLVERVAQSFRRQGKGVGTPRRCSSGLIEIGHAKPLVTPLPQQTTMHHSSTCISVDAAGEQRFDGILRRGKHLQPVGGNACPQRRVILNLAYNHANDSRFVAAVSLVACESSRIVSPHHQVVRQGSDRPAERDALRPLWRHKHRYVDRPFVSRHAGNEIREGRQPCPDCFNAKRLQNREGNLDTVRPPRPLCLSSRTAAR